MVGQVGNSKVGQGRQICRGIGKTRIGNQLWKDRKGKWKKERRGKHPRGKDEETRAGKK